MASNGNNNHTDITVPVSFLAEMAKIVGSTGDYLIFEGCDEAVDFLRGNEYTIFTEEDDITEWVRDNKAVEDVFDNEEMISYISDACSPDDVFTDEQLQEYIKDNCLPADVFEPEQIKEAYKYLVNMGDITEETFGKEETSGRLIKLVVPDETLLQAYEALKAENEKLKVFYEEWKHIEETTADGDEKNYVVPARIHNANNDERMKLGFENLALKEKIENYQKNTTHMDRALSDYHLLKNIFGEIIFGNRNAKDGQVWKFNSNEGHGEWC